MLQDLNLFKYRRQLINDTLTRTYFNSKNKKKQLKDLYYGLKLPICEYVIYECKKK